MVSNWMPFLLTFNNSWVRAATTTLHLGSVESGTYTTTIEKEGFGVVNTTLSVTAAIEKGGAADFKMSFVAFSVAGVVTSAVSKEPLKAAAVKLFKKNRDQEADAVPMQDLVTDDAGNYSLGKLPPGTYELVVDGDDEGDGDGVPRTYDEKTVTLHVVGGGRYKP